jgi:hypothetical protein
VVKLTDECGADIHNRIPEMKKDPGCPTITYTIGTQQFYHALRDLGARVSVMPKVVFDRLNYTELSPTTLQLQLTDSSIRYPAGIAEDRPVKIRDYFVRVNLVLLNMNIDKETSLILGATILEHC